MDQCEEGEETSGILWAKGPARTEEHKKLRERLCFALGPRALYMWLDWTDTAYTQHFLDIDVILDKISCVSSTTREPHLRWRGRLWSLSCVEPDMVECTNPRRWPMDALDSGCPGAHRSDRYFQMPDKLNNLVSYLL